MNDPLHPENGEAPPVVQLRPSRTNRILWAAAALCGGLALLLAVLMLLPVARRGVNHQDRYNAELSCRARINNAVTAVNASIILDFTDLSLASINGTDKGAAIAALSNDRIRAFGLKPLQATSVETCHRDPSYDLPKELLPTTSPTGSTP